MLNRIALVLTVLHFASPALAGDRPEDVRRRLEILATLPREQQTAPANQAFLRDYVRRSALLYLHRLDSLTCGDLFSLGNEATFIGAIGSLDGTDRNRIYLEGNGAPRHEDGGPYVFPADTAQNYFPPTPGMNTYWHEANHAILDAAGLEVNPRPYRTNMDSPEDAQGWRSYVGLTDGHHPFIEGVGQRGCEAYLELIEFERAVRRADAAESAMIAKGEIVSFDKERQIWADSHQRFSAFARAWRRVARMPQDRLDAYRAATGIFFSPAEAVAEFYRGGGMKRNERGEILPIRPPKWVFYPDLLLMPVQIQVTDSAGKDLELPGASAAGTVKDDVYSCEIRARIRARGSMERRTASQQQNRQIAAAVERGRLRVQLVEDDPLASLAIRQGVPPQSVSGNAVPGGASTHLFDADMSRGQPVAITFFRRQLRELKGPKSYKVRLTYTDPAPGTLYDGSETVIEFNVVGTAGGETKTGIGGSGQPGQAPDLPLKIRCPAEVMATEIFSVTADVPKELAARAAFYEWRGPLQDWKKYQKTKVLHVYMQFSDYWFREKRDPKPAQEKIGITVRDEKENRLGELEVPIAVRPAFVTASLPAKWKAQDVYPAAGFTFDREKIRIDRPGKIPSFESWAQVYVHWDESSPYHKVPESREAIEKELQERIARAAEEAKKDPRAAMVYETFEMGDFQAFMVGRPPYQAGVPENGVMPPESKCYYADYSADFHGYAIKGHCVLRIQGQAHARGGNKGDINDWPEVKSHCKAAYAEMMAVLKSVRMRPAPGHAVLTTPVQTPVATETVAPLEVALTGPAAPAIVGQTVDLSAAAKGGVAPYAFEWTGAQGQGAQAKFTADKAGTQKVSVKVKDAGNREATAAIEIAVQDPPPVTVTPPTPPAVPPPYTEKPIEKEEITGPPPPPPPEKPLPPEVPPYKPRKRPVPYSPPGGGYTITIPGWTKLDRKEGGAGQSFASQDRGYVVTCPDRGRDLPVDFKEFRQSLSAQCIKDPARGKCEMLDYGTHCGIRIRTTDENGRPVWNVFLGRGRRCFLFTVAAGPGAADAFPASLESAMAQMGMGE